MKFDSQNELIKIQILVDSILFKIHASHSLEDLMLILQDPEIKKYVMNKDRYHQLNLKITKEQVQSYISSGFFRADGSIDETKLEQENTATKLLYAFLWKQGDLQKVKYIVQGVTNQESVPESGMVLYYFGKHLADKRHPIIDQHVIRAYAMATKKPQINEDVLSKKDIDNIQSYIHWFQHELHPDISDNSDCRYMVDQVLYALGKRIKKEISDAYPKIYASNGRENFTG